MTSQPITPANSYRQRAILATALAAIIVLGPFFVLGSAQGHDTCVHLKSWMDVAEEWRAGVMYPRWAAYLNYGFGDTKFIFYPPESWMLGAALGEVLPWKATPGAFIFLVLVLAGISMFELAREWVPPDQAVLLAAFFAVNPYHLLLIYKRGAYAELLVSAIFPFLVSFALRLGHESGRAYLWLALAFAAVWLADAPAAVVATYALMLLVLVRAVGEKSPRVLVQGALASAVGLLLASFYIVPAWWEMKWSAISDGFSLAYQPEMNFLFTNRNPAPWVQSFDSKISLLIAVQVLIAGIAVFFCGRLKQAAPRIWRALATLGVASVFFMLPQSEPAWRIFPALRYVQFPWRWDFAFNLVFICLVGGAIACARKRWGWWMLTVTALVALGAGMVGRSEWNPPCLREFSAAIRSGKGPLSQREYAPVGCHLEALSKTSPEIALLDDVAEGQPQQAVSPDASTHWQIERWAPESRQFTVDASQPVALMVRLLNYPAWQVDVNGEPAQVETGTGACQMILHLAAGHSQVRVTFRQTLDRTLGAVLSLLGVGSWFGLAMVQGRRDARPSSSQNS